MNSGLLKCVHMSSVGITRENIFMAGKNTCKAVAELRRKIMMD
jgi:hypothetical protein